MPSLLTKCCAVVATLILLGGCYTLLPISAQTGPAEGAAPPAGERTISFLYTVNNLAYIDTCG